MDNAYLVSKLSDQEKLTTSARRAMDIVIFPHKLVDIEEMNMANQDAV